MDKTSISATLFLTDCAKQRDFRGATLEGDATTGAISSKGASTTREACTNSWRRIKRSGGHTVAPASTWMSAKNSNFYKWRCQDCSDGVCQVVNLGEEFRQEVQQLNHDIMLDTVELQILGTLNDEGRAMRAGQISGLLDITYQLVGKRTEKLRHGSGLKKAESR